MVNDAIWVQRAKRGDQDALVRIYESCQPSIFTYIFYRVNSQELAEDLTADVFTRMVSKLQTFEPGERPVLAWLYTIARNLLIDHYRGRDKVQVLPLEEALTVSEPGASTIQQVELQDQTARMHRLLGLLTEEQRLVLQWKFMESRSNAEIAEILSKSEGAVKALQHRALAALQRAMEQEGYYEAGF